MNENKFYIDLERIKVPQMSVLLAKYFTENKLYSHRTAKIEEVFKALMGMPVRAAGIMYWLTFKYKFQRARNYLSSSKRASPMFIQARRITEFSSVPTSNKRVLKVGYSISNKDTDFLKNNEILDAMREMIDEGIYKNKKRAEQIKQQKSLGQFLKGKMFGED